MIYYIIPCRTTKENMLLEYEKSDRFSNLKNNRIIDAFNNLLNEIYNMEV